MLLSRLPAIVFLAVSAAWSHPVASPDAELRIIGREQSSVLRRQASRSLHILARGNKEFRDNINAKDSGLLKRLTDEGQHPHAVFYGCSDSRVAEGTIFNALPGELFASRNIANQYHSTDKDSKASLAYSVAKLGVEHVLVMGHYGCGGVAAAIAPAPTEGADEDTLAIQQWISPIHQLFQSSNRSEIVRLREQTRLQPQSVQPDIHDAGFRALVEENVKASVARIAQDTIITKHHSRSSRQSGGGGATQAVFIHGWVYDIENGEIRDLGVTVGPPGMVVPPSPFPLVAAAAESVGGPHT